MGCSDRQPKKKNELALAGIFEEVYSQDKGYCEWVARQETTNVHMIEIGQFIQQVDANWENNSRELMMKELEEREQRLRANKLARLQEMEEKGERKPRSRWDSTRGQDV